VRTRIKILYELLCLRGEAVSTAMAFLLIGFYWVHPLISM
jgi:hypothetical protein